MPSRPPRDCPERRVPPVTEPMAIGSLVCGAAGIPCLCSCFFPGPLLGLMAVVLGISSIAQIRRAPLDRTGEGLAKTGIALGAITIGLALVFVVFYGVLILTGQVEL